MSKVASYLLVALLCFGMGYFIGGSYSETGLLRSTQTVTQTEIQRLARTMEPGTEITIKTEKRNHPAYFKSIGEEVTSSQDYVGFRNVSWFGLSPNEVVAKMRFQIGDMGRSMQAWAQGYGIAEQTWSRLKSLFWVGVLLLFVTLVLMVIPQTKFIGVAIARIFGWIFGLFGAAIEWLYHHDEIQKRDKVIKQVVDGGQQFKANIKNGNALSSEQKEHVIRTFKASHVAQQDKDVQLHVKHVK